MKTIDGIDYSEDLTILYRCPQDKRGTVVVPEGTLGILQEAFKGCAINAVVLPTTLKRIGREAFANCKELKGVKLPDGIEHLGARAFFGCFALSYVILPDSLTKLQNGTFSECIMLKDVRFPKEGLESIGDDCFKNCFNLEKIAIPASVIKIGKAFRECWHLKKVIIRSTIVDVNKNAFEGCAEKIEIVKKFNIKGFFRENNKGGQHKSKAIKITRKGFAEIKNGLKLWLPSNVDAIEEYAFYNSTGLNLISIPGSVNIISRFAFAGCSGLSVLEIKEGVEIIEKSAFEGCTALTSLFLPNSIAEVRSKAFSGCTSLSRVTLSKNTVVADDAFEGVPEGLQITYSEDNNSSYIASYD